MAGSSERRDVTEGAGAEARRARRAAPPGKSGLGDRGGPASRPVGGDAAGTAGTSAVHVLTSLLSGTLPGQPGRQGTPADGLSFAASVVLTTPGCTAPWWATP